MVPLEWKLRKKNFLENVNAVPSCPASTATSRSAIVFRAKRRIIPQEIEFDPRPSKWNSYFISEPTLCCPKCRLCHFVGIARKPPSAGAPKSLRLEVRSSPPGRPELTEAPRHSLQPALRLRSTPQQKYAIFAESTLARFSDDSPLELGVDVFCFIQKKKKFL